MCVPAYAGVCKEKQKRAYKIKADFVKMLSKAPIDLWQIGDHNELYVKIIKGKYHKIYYIITIDSLGSVYIQVRYNSSRKKYISVDLPYNLHIKVKKLYKKISCQKITETEQILNDIRGWF